RTHVGQLLLTLLYGKGEGPKISGIAFLEHFSFSTKTIFETGTPYTAFDLKGNQVGEHNALREPNFFQTDFTITRNFPLGDLFGGSGSSSLDVQLEILNLLNRTEEVYVFNTTGQGDDDGKTPVYNYTRDILADATNQS